MTIERLNPDGMNKPGGYTHVVRARGGTTIFVAGQTPLDADGNLVGEGDLEAQTRKVFENVRDALAAVGADFSHVAKMTTYIVGYQPEMLPAFRAVRESFVGAHLPASTLVGVAALALPGFLIEVEVTAVLD